MVFQGWVEASAVPKNESHFQGRLMPPSAPGNPILGAVAALPAPENEPYFQGRLMPPSAPKNVFPGAGQML